jgi:precorrin-4 methylase
MNNNLGALYLVSAGIGDIDNMTVRAQKTIATSDIVLTMNFIRDQLGDLLDGKEIHNAGHGLFSGTEFNSGSSKNEDKVRSIIRNGISEGKTISVVDFGDPTIYSPHSAYLTEFSDLNPVIIPGISSFNAGNAALCRELTGSYDRAIILTEVISKWEGSLERLRKLAATQSTLILFSMRLDLKKVVQELICFYPANTPIAIVTYAGFSEQEDVIRGTLGSIIEQTQDIRLPWQHLIYVGDFLA